jgi:hypothetical protein
MNFLAFVAVCIGAYAWVGWPGVAVAAGAALVEHLTGNGRKQR